VRLRETGHRRGRRAPAPRARPGPRRRCDWLFRRDRACRRVCWLSPVWACGRSFA